MKCDEIFDAAEGVQTWYAKVAACLQFQFQASWVQHAQAEVAILLKDEAPWAKQYIAQCEGGPLCSWHVGLAGLDADHWQRIQVLNLRGQVPDPSLKLRPSLSSLFSCL